LNLLSDEDHVNIYIDVNSKTPSVDDVPRISPWFSNQLPAPRKKAGRFISPRRAPLSFDQSDLLGDPDWV
jgi:hypothetical protein